MTYSSGVSGGPAARRGNAGRAAAPKKHSAKMPSHRLRIAYLSYPAPLMRSRRLDRRGRLGGRQRNLRSGYGRGCGGIAVAEDAVIDDDGDVAGAIDGHEALGTLGADDGDDVAAAEDEAVVDLGRIGGADGALDDVVGDGAVTQALRVVFFGAGAFGEEVGHVGVGVAGAGRVL